MSTSAIWTLAAIDIAGTLYSGIQSQKMDMNTQLLMGSGDGHTDLTFIGTTNQDPSIEFVTTDLTILSTIGMSGLSVSATACNFYWQSITKGGTRATGSSHYKITMNEGCIYPVSLQARQGDKATVTCKALATYNGTNNPFVFAGSAALAGVGAIASMWTVGPASVNGTALNGIQETSINFGMEPYTVRSDGSGWPEFVAIRERHPVISMTTVDMTTPTTFGLLGSATTAFITYFRKKAAGGGTVADGTGGHIKLSGTTGRVEVESQDASHPNEATSKIKITPRNDGTNAVIVINTAASIS